MDFSEALTETRFSNSPRAHDGDQSSSFRDAQVELGHRVGQLGPEFLAQFGGVLAFFVFHDLLLCLSNVRAPRLVSACPIGGSGAALAESDGLEHSENR